MFEIGQMNKWRGTTGVSSVLSRHDFDSVISLGTLSEDSWMNWGKENDLIVAFFF